LRESLWNLFVEFKKSGRLLTVKIDGEHEARYALLTFRKSSDVTKALTFAINKTINGVRLKAEPYDGITNETDECDIMKRTICPDPDFDEYSIKATRTLYIGNLQSEISYNELREDYSAYGDIIVCELNKNYFPKKNEFLFK
jgi:RNA recognition motif-containing protein